MDARSELINHSMARQAENGLMCVEQQDPDLLWPLGYQTADFLGTIPEDSGTERPVPQSQSVFKLPFGVVSHNKSSAGA